VNASQLKALKLVLQRHPRHARIILPHCHILEYPGESISLRVRIGLALVNALGLLATLVPHAARILVLHGHRHWDWLGAYGDVVLGSAPSAALGADAAHKYCRSFHVHDLTFGVGGGVRPTRTERVGVG
jgi:hypothetical protein